MGYSQAESVDVPTQPGFQVRSSEGINRRTWEPHLRFRLIGHLTSESGKSALETDCMVHDPPVVIPYARIRSTLTERRDVESYTRGYSV
jgi:hypothetical protein